MTYKGYKDVEARKAYLREKNREYRKRKKAEMDDIVRDWNGQVVCTLCYERLQKGEITLEKSRPKPKTVEVAPRVETKSIKPPDTWEHRKASMQVPVSKMEESVLIKLEAKGLHPEVQKEFCLQRTRPDYYFPQQNIAVYLDGEVHRGREDRDDALRMLLTKRYGVRVVSILYEGSSEVTEDKIVQEIIASTASS